MAEWWEYVVAATAVGVMATMCATDGRAQVSNETYQAMGNLTKQAKAIVSGPARVIDGDTIEIRQGIKRHRIRIHGIDAPELTQTCQGKELGKAARDKLHELTDGYHVDCFILTTDRYQREIGYCHAAGKDIAAEMIREGYAFAFYRYTARYWAEEDEAKNEQRGVWGAKCMRAWEWRELNPVR